jgi:hypothetical protein
MKKHRPSGSHTRLGTFGLLAALALGPLGVRAATSSGEAATPAAPAGLQPAARADVTPALWMDVDQVRGQVLVYLTEDWMTHSPARLLLFDLQGKLVRSHELPDLRGHHVFEAFSFPHARTLALSAYPYGDEAWLLHLGTGQVQRLGVRSTAQLAADSRRGRLFVAEGRQLVVIDAANGRVLQRHKLARDVVDLNVSEDGTVSFILEKVGQEGLFDRIVSLSPPHYPLRFLGYLRSRGDWSRLVGFDTRYGHAIVQHRWSWPERNRSELTVVRPGDALPVRLGTRLGAAALLGYDETAPYLYVYDPRRCSAIRIHSARTLAFLGAAHTLDACRSSVLGRDARGRLFVESRTQGDSELQLLNPRTLRVVHRWSLEGGVQLASIDERHNVAYLVVSVWDGVSRFHDKLLKLDLGLFAPAS